MAITRVGSAAADGATITIPAGHQVGDLLLIFSFRSALTAPSLPAGWTGLLTNSTGGTSYRLGWKLAVSGADTSGTWTNATGLICTAYRGISTTRTPVGTPVSSTNTNATPNYAQITPLLQANNSWISAFAAIVSTTSTLETPPTNMTNHVNTVGAAVEYAGHDTNGAYKVGTGNWPATTANATVSAEWRVSVIEIFPENLSLETMPFASGGLSQTEIFK